MVVSSEEFKQRCNNWTDGLFLFNRCGSGSTPTTCRACLRQTRILGHGALNRWTRGRRHTVMKRHCRRSTNRRPQGKLCVTCRLWPVACYSLHAQTQWYTLVSSLCFSNSLRAKKKKIRIDRVLLKIINSGIRL